MHLLIATIATESGGKVNAVRFESGYQDEATTPHRVSSGLMQTLLSTARDMLQQTVGIEALQDPLLSLRAGALYIASQVRFTDLDPVLVSATYNAGRLEFQNGIKNRWKLRQYPLGTSLHVDRFIRFYNDSVTAIGNSVIKDSYTFTKPLRPVNMPASPKVRFSNPEKGAFVPGYAISIIQNLLRLSNNKCVVVSSTLRNPEEQATVMYKNCETFGVNSQMELYGVPGKSVISEYVKAKEKKLGKEATIRLMRDKIMKEGPYNVSHHAGDPSKLAVLDIAPSSLTNPDGFIKAALKDRRISRIIVPDKDPAIHIEIPLTKE